MKPTMNPRSGQLSISVLFFATISVVLLTGFIFLATSLLQLSLRELNRSQAFTIAEAGIEYYRWHLAHDTDDFQDGTGQAGPYVHDYYDKDGVKIGTFTLTITPPPTGSTVVTIRSQGQVEADPSISKIIEVRLGIASLARIQLAVNSDLEIGSTTEIFGEVMANGGIRFDGYAHNTVKSALEEYDDLSHGGQEEFGVHTHRGTVDPEPPAAVPSRPDVFAAGREFPVPAIDFTGLTQDLADLKADALGDGYYATSSGAQGYDLVLAPDDTYQVYKVTAVTPPPNGCTNTSNEDGWGTWSVESETLVASGTLPASGKMFFEDNLWVRGSIDGARVTIASGKFPDNAATRTSISVNNDLTYTNYNGLDTIALIAQKNINIGLYSEDILRIDAALLAQNGRIGRYYYQPPNNESNNNRCGPPAIRQQITLHGMIGSNLTYALGYADLSGYQERIIVYDANLLYNPPPGFPLTTNQYSQISWDEVQ